MASTRSGQRTLLLVLAVMLGMVIGPVAAGAAGQLVTLVDSRTSNEAVVDATGALRTTAVPGLAARSFAVSSSSIPNYYNNSNRYTTVIGPTTARLAITSVTFTNSVYNANTWEVLLYRTSGATTTECQTLNSSKRYLKRNVPVAESSVTNFDPPLYVKPRVAGEAYCLVVGAGPRSDQTADSSLMAVDINGYVIAGPFSEGAPGPSQAPPAGPSSDGPDQG